MHTDRIDDLTLIHLISLCIVNVLKAKNKDSLKRRKKKTGQLRSSLA